MTNGIEWDVAADPLRACLMVKVKERGILRPATLEDLRKACEAVGLHVVDEVANWKDQSIKDWAELAKRQTSWLADVRKALDPTGISHADLATMASATVAARDLAMAAAEKAESEAATLRAQLAEASQSATSPEGRATDEELIRVYCDQWKPSLIGGGNVDAGVVAVAARVRRERHEGLVERLVAKGVDFDVWERESDATWTVRVIQPGTNYTTNVTDLPAADVPATLARLAGLDGGT